MLHPILTRTAAAFAALVLTVSHTAAQTCTADDFAKAVDQVGAKLRQQKVDARFNLPAKLQKLVEKKGWREDEVEAKGFDMLQDDETRALDDKAADLLQRLDKLSDPGSTPDCGKLAEIENTGTELASVTAKKSERLAAKIDAELGNAKPGVTKPAAAAKTEKPAPAKPETKTATREPQPAPAPPDNVKTAPPVVTKPKVDDSYKPPQPAGALAALPPLKTTPDLAFTEDEIRDAGKGFFGTISSELAAVIQYAFNSYGRPTGYILGTEGGGAFLAGLRYGKGDFVSKTAGKSKIYWQGPSIGTDLGAAGSRVMVLVYNATTQDDLHRRFAGVDGSAFVAGGAGITFLKKGPIVLAPIRTGIGLRLGASVGYLKFTPEVSLNPF